ncbi:MAG TPA: MerR family transcriptional regulator [Gaiellaceae bacterium]
MAERTVPLFSIGAVARMLDLSAATIRTWETRYGYVIPQRSEGGQRLYSRDQADQLRFVKDEVDGGRRPGEAHGLLAERVERGDSFGGTRLRVLFVESKAGASAVLKELLGTDAFEVLIASDPASAEQVFDELSPVVVVVDVEDGDFEELAKRIRSAGVKVLPLGLLERPLALLDPARPALR